MALAVLLCDPEENTVALSRRPSAPGPGRRAAGGSPVSPGALGQRPPRPGPLAEVAGVCAAVGPPHLRAPPRSLLSAGPRVASGP